MSEVCLEVPMHRTVKFRNLCALLDYCKWVRPDSFSAVVLEDGTCELTYVWDRN